MAVGLDNASGMRFGDGDALKVFFLEHRLAHAANASAIATLLGSNVPGFDVADDRARLEWELLMIPSDEERRASAHLSSWLQLHAMVHQAEYDALNLGPATELATVDFSDQQQFYLWMQDHQYAHDLVGSTLGVA